MGKRLTCTQENRDSNSLSSTITYLNYYEIGIVDLYKNIKKVKFKVLKNIKGPYRDYHPSDEILEENIDFDHSAIVQGFKDYAYFKDGDIEIVKG